jgi:hypothetical protein
VGGWRRWSSAVVGRQCRTWAELAARERERERERDAYCVVLDGDDAKRPCLWMNLDLLKVEKKYGENILLKVSDRKPKATAPKRKGGIEKRKSSKGVICR